MNQDLKQSVLQKMKTLQSLQKEFLQHVKKEGDVPPWEIAAEKIRHNKKKKIIDYENAFLKFMMFQ